MGMRAEVTMLWLLALLSLALGSPLRCLDCFYEGKRDIFMSRGWGAGGMPFTLLRPNQVLLAHRLGRRGPSRALLGWAEMSLEGTKVHILDGTWTNVNEMSSESLSPRDQPTVEYLTDNRQDGRQNSRQDPDSRREPTIPQLFVSYGWGPLGK